MKRIRYWLKVFTGWLDCPRCGGFVFPRYESFIQGRWRCPNCDHVNW